MSPKTKSIAISLNKHKFDEVSQRPQLLQEIENNENDLGHRNECSCEIKEIQYKDYTLNVVGDYKLFISCKYAASDFPDLIKHKIDAILSVGDEPKHFSSISGGYMRLLPSHSSLNKPLMILSRFLNAKLKVGNVLVHCDSGNRHSGILIIAYLLRETKMVYQCAFDIVKRARPYFYITYDEEKLVKCYDHTRARQ